MRMSKVNLMTNFISLCFGGAEWPLFKSCDLLFGNEVLRYNGGIPKT